MPAIRIPHVSRFWVDVDRTYHQRVKLDRCYQTLLTAERRAPEEVRFRPTVRTGSLGHYPRHGEQACPACASSPPG